MRAFLVIGALLALLVAAVVGAIHVMGSVTDEVSGHGWVATVMGVVGSVVLGGGLMALVFISNRRGYDDRVDDAAGAHDQPPKQP